ncbi:MAG: hypothetical protein IPK44_13010 [Candidatus Accumulibacter sp.]|uniref:hypothetical protein n=1 Tax=Accumulibacter sp. TaxID=2053492 RepID=UPI00258BFD6B|nr:hypothetical protein [Accumulibacter sp.]MBK8115374.1 hypothetical protein [Accumulibacter sp.]
MRQFLVAGHRFWTPQGYDAVLARFMPNGKATANLERPLPSRNLKSTHGSTPALFLARIYGVPEWDDAHGQIAAASGGRWRGGCPILVFGISQSLYVED